MPSGDIGGYQGAAGNFDVLEGNGQKFIKVYNDTGAALTNGTVKVLEWLDDVDSLSVSAYPTLGTAATNASALVTVVVVNNTPMGKASIADATWGYVQVEGYCETIIAATGGVTDEQYLEVLNGGTAATDDGATLTTKSFGIAKATALAAATFAGVLFGHRVVVAAA